MQINENRSNENNVKKAILWECRKATKGTRITDKEGCGKWQIMMSKRTNGDRTDKWQSKCKECGKRKNLKYHYVRFFDSKEEAKEYLQSMKNGSGWF